MDYPTLVTTLADYLVPLSLQSAGVPTDPDFIIALPLAISYANNRICRMVDFLQFSTSQNGPALTLGSRIVDLSALTTALVVVEQINIKVGSALRPLTQQSKPYLDMVWGDPSVTGLPSDYTMLDTQTALIGPYPDSAYGTDVFGVYRPPPISATVTTTWLCDNLPEAFVAACMVNLSGWRKDYLTASSDDPQAAPYWESQFTKLMEGIDMEEARRSYTAASWSSQMPSRAATPPRQ